MGWQPDSGAMRARRRASPPWRGWLRFVWRNPLLVVGVVLITTTIIADQFHLRRNDAVQRFFSYRNCAAMRADGLSSVPVGHPAYRSWLDADGDGIACEPWHPYRHRR